MPKERNSVSFITVNLNNSCGLLKTIQSYGNLKHSLGSEADIELIVVDGASSDTSLAIIRQNAANITRYISEVDEGIYDAMWKGVKLASARLVCFMNSGDTIIPAGMKELIMNHANEEYAVAGVPSWAQARVGFFALHFCPPMLRMPNHQCMLIPKKFAQSHPFDSRFPIAADLDQKLALHKSGMLRTTNIVTTHCDPHGLSRTINTFRKLNQRAMEQASVANKHYGTVLAIINYLIFTCWHARKPIKRLLHS